MKLLDTAYWTDMQRPKFEDDCFSAWLNKIDATIDYEVRRTIGSVPTWRRYWDAGYADVEAIQDLQYVRDNRAFCGE